MKRIARAVLGILFFAAIIAAIGTNPDLPEFQQLAWFTLCAGVAALCAVGLDALGTFGKKYPRKNRENSPKTICNNK